MDLENLKAFVAIAEYKSFSVAAEKLFITQPAISKRLSALELSLGASLIDRTTRDIRLTPAGLALFPRAEAILQSVTLAKREIDDLAGEIKGELRVATSHHLGLHKLPPVLRAFSSTYPEVNLRFEFLDSEIAQNRVISGKSELAVITLPPKPMQNLISEVLWPDPLVFVTHPDNTDNFNHVERKGDHIATLKWLSQQPAILPDLNTFTGRLIKRCFDENDLSIRLNMATNYLETIKMMVSVGLGWSVLPLSMVDEHIQQLDVKHVKLQRDLGIVRHASRPLSNAAEAFHAMLRAKNSG